MVKIRANDTYRKSKIRSRVRINRWVQNWKTKWENLKTKRRKKWLETSSLDNLIKYKEGISRFEESIQIENWAGNIVKIKKCQDKVWKWNWKLEKLSSWLLNLVSLTWNVL